VRRKFNVSLILISRLEIRDPARCRIGTHKRSGAVVSVLLVARTILGFFSSAGDAGNSSRELMRWDVAKSCSDFGNLAAVCRGLLDALHGGRNSLRARSFLIERTEGTSNSSKARQ
jgi:hypothetical protein